MQGSLFSASAPEPPKGEVYRKSPQKARASQVLRTLALCVLLRHVCRLSPSPEHRNYSSVVGSWVLGCGVPLQKNHVRGRGFAQPDKTAVLLSQSFAPWRVTLRKLFYQVFWTVARARQVILTLATVQNTWCSAIAENGKVYRTNVRWFCCALLQG